jgi:hypothetical protein
MKISAVLLIVAAVALACGCRHTYEPAPPPYYCQPAGCGCTPAPACNPCANPCAPANAPYLPQSSSTLQPRLAPTTTTTTTVTPAPGVYSQPGGYTLPANSVPSR